MNPETNVLAASPNPSKAFPGILQSLALLVLSIVVGCAVLLLLNVLSRLIAFPLFPSMTSEIATLATMVVTFWVGLRWSGAKFQQACPLTHFPLRQVPALLLTAFGVAILTTALAAHLPGAEKDQQWSIRKSLQRTPAINFFLCVLIYPVASECLLRGIILRGYLGRYSTRQAIWASAIVSAIFVSSPWMFLLALPDYLWLAWLVVHSGSLLPSILVVVTSSLSTHALLPMLVQALGYPPMESGQPTSLPLPVVALGLLLALGAGFLHWRQFRITESSPVPVVKSA